MLRSTPLLTMVGKGWARGKERNACGVEEGERGVCRTRKGGCGMRQAVVVAVVGAVNQMVGHYLRHESHNGSVPQHDWHQFPYGTCQVLCFGTLSMTSCHYLPVFLLRSCPLCACACVSACACVCAWVHLTPTAGVPAEALPRACLPQPHAAVPHRGQGLHSVHSLLCTLPPSLPHAPH